MAKWNDFVLVVLALIAAAFVLAAPVVGRAGYDFAADVLVVLAATSGLAGFLVAATHTFLHVRVARPDPARERPEKRSC
jgi:hypothetical protein